MLHVHPRDMAVTKGDDVSSVRHGSKTRNTLALTLHFRLAGKRKPPTLAPRLHWQRLVGHNDDRLVLLESDGFISLLAKMLLSEKYI